MRNSGPRGAAAIIALGLSVSGCQTAGRPSADVSARGDDLTPQQIADLGGEIARQIEICADRTAYTPGFMPTLRVVYNEDGHIIGNPEILVYGKTPAEAAAIDGAIRAIRRCDPLGIGGLYRSHLRYWRTQVYRFSDAAKPIPGAPRS